MAKAAKLGIEVGQVTSFKQAHLCKYVTVTLAMVTTSLSGAQIPFGGSGGHKVESPDSFQRRVSPPETKTDIRILHGIADTYAKASKSAFKEGNYATAERAARNGLAVLPGNVTLLRLQGEALIRLGYETEALRVLREVNDSQQDTASFARIGWLMARLGQTSESLNMASSGVLDQLLPESLVGTVPYPRSQKALEAYWLLTIAIEAEMYANDDESIYYYKAALEIWPSHVVPNFRLGKIYLRKHRWQEAADCYGRITTGPEKVVADAKVIHDVAVRMVAKGG